MPRHLLLLLPLAACGLLGLSSDQRQSIANHQSNAQLYWDGGNIGQALDQTRRGLEIDPNDYKLRAIRAWCLLRQSQSDERELDAAAREFDRVIALRADDAHSPFARVGYARVQAMLGLRSVRQAQDARAELERTAPASETAAARSEEIARLETAARAQFDRAQQQLQHLVANGESLLLAYYDLMTVQWWQGDYDGAVRSAHAYLARAAEEQARVRAELERTLTVPYEAEQRQALQTLIDNEVRVRAFMANMHYKHGHHELVVEQLDRVLAQDPNMFNEYYNRGRSLIALGRLEAGKRDFEKFLASTSLPAESAPVRDALRLLREQK